MKNIIFISLIINILCSCGKNGSTIVSGKVFEKGTNKPIANADVIFSQCVEGDGTFSPSICADIATIKTNAQGEYTFSATDEDAASSYRIRVEKKYYGNAYPVFHTAEACEKTKNLDFTMSAYAWIKFHVKNTTPFDENDWIGAPGALNYADKYYFFGKDVDKTYILQSAGNQKNYEYWRVNKNGKISIFKDSIFCKSLDTTFYEIKY